MTAPPDLDPLSLAAIFGGLGLIVGSFLALVSVRLPQGEDVVSGRSRCRSCARPLRVVHLIPVLSWLALRGRCADCGAPISARHPLIELAAAGLAIWSAIQSPTLALAVASSILAWQLILIAVIDGEHFQLFDVLSVLLILTGLVQGALSGWDEAGLRLIGAGVGFSVLWAIGVFYARVRGRMGIGDGDPILFAAAGTWVGPFGLPSVLLWASLAGLSLVAARLLLRRRVRGDDRLAFGTLLAIGIWLTWLYGPIGL